MCLWRIKSIPINVYNRINSSLVYYDIDLYWIFQLLLTDKYLQYSIVLSMAYISLEYSKVVCPLIFVNLKISYFVSISFLILNDGYLSLILVRSTLLHNKLELVIIFHERDTWAHRWTSVIGNNDNILTATLRGIVDKSSLASPVPKKSSSSSPSPFSNLFLIY